MSCEICSRGNCCRSFHSLEEQQEFDSIVGPYKDKIESSFSYEVEHICSYHKEDIDDEDEYVKLTDVKNMIQCIL